MDNIVRHHLHLRKSVYNNLEPYPHPNPQKRFLDRLIFVVGALNPLFTLPQIYKIYSSHAAAGVSAVSWSAYFIFSIVWFIYGIVHKEKAIMFTYALWIIMNALVALGAIIY